MKIAITGARGLLGWHAAARLHAQNCGANFKGEMPPYELSLINRDDFADSEHLAAKLHNVDAILHFAGVNRGDDKAVSEGNPEIARALSVAAELAKIRPYIAFANSIHADADTVYGRSKAQAAEILQSNFDTFIDFHLPHIFGECAKPDYNNVTATIIDRIWSGAEFRADPKGRVELLHAGDAANAMISAVTAVEPVCGRHRLEGKSLAVADLEVRLRAMFNSYQANIFPDLADHFDVNLFNCLRVHSFPDHYPINLDCKADERGALFEVAKGGGGGQSFVSTTKPGIARGNHFHTSLVERFVVLSGQAQIRIRRVLSDVVHSFDVDGNEPVAIDQLPLHTHEIINIGDEELTTYFWAHRVFDPQAPDTFYDEVG